MHRSYFSLSGIVLNFSVYILETGMPSEDNPYSWNGIGAILFHVCMASCTSYLYSDIIIDDNQISKLSLPDVPLKVTILERNHILAV